jgi:hypothetical protein
MTIASACSGASDSPVSLRDSRPVRKSAPARNPRLPSPVQSANSGALKAEFPTRQNVRPTTA